MGKDTRRFAGQTATQSRVNWKSRELAQGPDSLGEYPRLEIPRFLSSLCLHHTTITGNNVYLCLKVVSLVVTCICYLLSFPCEPLGSVHLHICSSEGLKSLHYHSPDWADPAFSGCLWQSFSPCAAAHWPPWGASTEEKCSWHWEKNLTWWTWDGRPGLSWHVPGILWTVPLLLYHTAEVWLSW